ncbi:MAG: WD40 repeat domain-containing protein [Candidatus Omnitrophota bacterium]|nr:WD40 repeat domain-containing protein [Candidatus Omnitrophota bacterium]
MEIYKIRKNIFLFVFIGILVSLFFLLSERGVFSQDSGDTVVGAARKQSLDTIMAEAGILRKIPHVGEVTLDFPVLAVAFSPKNDEFLVTADRSGGIKLWETKKRFSLGFTLAGHAKEAYAVAFSSDGKYLASGGADQFIKVWDIASKSLVKTIRAYTGTIDALQFSPDNSILASANLDNLIELWEAKDGGFYHVTSLTGHQGSVYSVSFHPNNKYLVSSGKDKEIRIWPIGTKDTQKILEAHMHIVLDAKFSPKGGFLASGGADNIANLWRLDFKKGKLLLSDEPILYYIHKGWVTRVGFSRDDKFFVTSSQFGDLRIWDLSTMKLIKLIPVFSSQPIFDFAFSNNGKYLAVAGKEGKVFIYNWRDLISESGVEAVQEANPKENVISEYLQPN